MVPNADGKEVRLSEGQFDFDRDPKELMPGVFVYLNSRAL